MKKNILTIFLISLMFSSITVSAQETIINDVNYTQLEQFIELAKINYPRSKIMDLNEKKAKYLAPIETLSYLDMFNAAYFYRPKGKTALDASNPYIINGFQFGVNVSLGTFLDKPYRIKQAKIDYEIAKLENDDYEKVLTLEVKSRYYMYILQLKQLKLSSQAAQDAKAIADDIALRFERGEIELEGYNSSKTAFNSANSAKIQTEVAYLSAKDQLEEIIGKKLTEIEGL